MDVLKVERSRRYEGGVRILSPRPPTYARVQKQHSGPEGAQSESSESVSRFICAIFYVILFFKKRQVQVHRPPPGSDISRTRQCSRPNLNQLISVFFVRHAGDDKPERACQFILRFIFSSA